MKLIYKVAKKIKLNELKTKIITKPIRNLNVFKAKLFKEKYKVSEKFIDNCQVITFAKSFEFNKNIIFLHGGSYRDEALILHRKFTERIIDNYDTKVTFIDYPLAPENTYKEIQDLTYKAINYLFSTYKNDKFYIIGDSSGGGLAVSMLKRLRNNKKNIINKTILLSPWIDVSMSNPKLIKQAEKDFTLNLEQIKEYGQDYAGNLNTKNEKVSPLYGNLNNLGNFLIFTCNNELLYPDILKFHKKIKKSKNSDSTLKSFKDLYHDWVLIPTKESKVALDEIIEFFEK